MTIPFDYNIHLGDLLVTTILSGILLALRRIYKLVAGKMLEHEHLIADVDAHAAVINIHSSLWNKSGAVDVPIPFVERRKTTRVVVNVP